MIAAVSPTSASSRNGTPAPRSDSASRPPARLYCTTTVFNSAADQPVKLAASRPSTGVIPSALTGPDRRMGGSDPARSRTGEAAERPPRIVGVDGRRRAGDVGAGYRHRPDLT